MPIKWLSRDPLVSSRVEPNKRMAAPEVINDAVEIGDDLDLSSGCPISLLMA